MRADYDLVILGDSYSARWAALTAVRHHARVALVRQAIGLDLAIVLQSLSDLIAIAECQGLSLPFAAIHSFQRWLKQHEPLPTALSFNRLSQQGVDVVLEPGHFIHAPTKKTIFETQNRQLRSRRYLLALPPVSAISLGTRTHHSLQSLFADLEHCSTKTIYLEGHHPWAITMGQVLQYLGFRVVIFTEGQILPSEDPEVSFFIQCTLESKGIEIRTVQPSHSENGLWLKPQASSPWKALQLEKVGLNIAPDHDAPLGQIAPNFQTAHPNLYVAGSRFNHLFPLAILQRETTMAVKNALFSLKETPDLRQWVYQVPIGFGLCRGGLTESQANRQYSDAETLTRNFEHRGTPIFCKLIARQNGTILGIHLLGLPASESQGVIYLLFTQNIPVMHLDELAIEHPILRQIFADFAHRWRQVKLPKIRDRREQYFRKKRKRFS